jgi:hypothetical protein
MAMRAGVGVAATGHHSITAVLRIRARELFLGRRRTASAAWHVFLGLTLSLSMTCCYSRGGCGRHRASVVRVGGRVGGESVRMRGAARSIPCGVWSVECTDYRLSVCWRPRHTRLTSLVQKTDCTLSFLSVHPCPRANSPLPRLWLLLRVRVPIAGADRAFYGNRYERVVLGRGGRFGRQGGE